MNKRLDEIGGHVARIKTRGSIKPVLEVKSEDETYQPRITEGLERDEIPSMDFIDDDTQPTSFMSDRNREKGLVVD